MELSNVDLSSVSGHISYSYDNAAEALASSLLDFAFLLVILTALGLFLVYYMDKIYPKSKVYRELLSDMYVSGKVKEIAKKDGIDLNQELKEFSSIVKKSKLGLKQISKIVEEELNEKIIADFEKAKDKK